MSSHRRFPPRNTGLNQGSRRRSHRPHERRQDTPGSPDHDSPAEPDDAFDTPAHRSPLEPPFEPHGRADDRPCGPSATDPFPLRRETTGREGGFVRCWTSSLDPIVRHWLHASIQREAIERSGCDPDEGVLASAIEVLVEACADAQDVRVAELRLLVPSIDVECAEYVLTMLRWDLQQAEARRNGSIGRLASGRGSHREESGDRKMA